MFQKGLALKQKKIQSKTSPSFSFPSPSIISDTTIITSHTDSTSQMKSDSNPKKTRTVTLSSVLLAKRFSSTLLAPVNRSNVTVTNIANPTETTITAKKQHNPRRHVFATTGAVNENQNPTTISSGEKVKDFQ